MNSDQQLIAFILILTRVSAFVSFLPLFARRQLPHLVKAGLAVGLTVFWFGILEHGPLFSATTGGLSMVLFMAKEVGVGFVLAMLAGLIFVPARIAGAYIGQEVGLSLASVTSPGTADSSTVVTTVLEAISILLFFGLNLHHFLILMLHHSFLQLGGDVSLFDLPFELVVNLYQTVAEQGCVIAAPIGICLFVLTIALALLNRAAPSLNLFSVGMSLRSGLGLLLLVLFFPVVVNSIVSHFETHQFQIQDILFSFDT